MIYKARHILVWRKFIITNPGVQYECNNGAKFLRQPFPSEGNARLLPYSSISPSQDYNGKETICLSINRAVHVEDVDLSSLTQ